MRKVASTEGIGLAFPAGELVQRYQGGIGPHCQGEWEQRFLVALTLGRPEVQRCHVEVERRYLGDSPIFD